MHLLIRPEQAADVEAIGQLTAAAFKPVPHSSHTEPFILDALRRAEHLTISLVALNEGKLVGHVAVSPVTLSPDVPGWYGLGPVSVLPAWQRQGIGSQLIRVALAQLTDHGGRGCVVLGEPAYYRRFGFRPEAGLVLPGVPPAYFQAVCLQGTLPTGVVCYHEAFAATE